MCSNCGRNFLYHTSPKRCCRKSPKCHKRSVRCRVCSPKRVVINSSFGASLNGCNEVPPTASLATGQLVGLLSSDNLKFDFVLQTTGLVNITSAHFNLGFQGTNGPIVKTITVNPVTGGAVGSWTSTDAEPLTPTLVTSLKDGSIYISVDTALFPTGEIRGQVVPLDSHGKTKCGCDDAVDA